MSPDRHLPERTRGRWYVPLFTGLAALVAIWAIAEQSSLKAGPNMAIASERSRQDRGQFAGVAAERGRQATPAN